VNADVAEVATGDPWAGMVGQDSARARLETAAANPVHAYLFLGSRGSGTFRAALGFAGLVLAHPIEAADGKARALSLAVQGKHPDVVVVEPQGASLRVVEAEEIIRAGLRTPVEGSRKVIVVTGIEVLEEAAIGKLLKVVEEPPPSTVFVLLAEEVPPEMVTIASRCVTVEFGPLTTAELERALLDTGVDAERAAMAAAAAGGDLDRARLLATDDDLAARAEAWRSVPDRLDGTGFQVTELVDQVRDGMDRAQGPLEARQAVELEALEERVEQLGERGSGRAELVARHRREVRRARTDELRFGLATLARVYRDRLVEGDTPAAIDAAEAALAAVQETAENLIRNPNEALLLHALFLRLSPERT
jgi:DNA polymerase-3 subunit delta'